ncbi:sulfite exporter TauE/SafE family protein [Candidatus Peregrinibacteria bacterium]|nr:sulfite exporter TauE/SafE family protein [Candidatus Peregrinibacteria bacterium]
MNTKNPFLITGAGASVGLLGGLIGLGGAEFRLPILISIFKYSALPVVILNKTMSLAVVASALPFRASVIPFYKIAENWNIIVTLLAGSLLGALYGADLATKMKTHTLYKVLSILLVIIAIVLFFGHNASSPSEYLLSGISLLVVGIIVGFFIGVVAALMGVAGGELLIPTIILLFGADIKLAGSMALAVSLPTMIVGFARYSKDKSFSVIKLEWRFVILMVIGSFIGSFLGGLLLNYIPTGVLLPLLSIILLISAVKVWKHASGKET